MAPTPRKLNDPKPILNQTAWPFLAALLAASAGCSTAPKGTSTKVEGPGAPPSSVDIAYVLGHNERRLHAESGATGVSAQAILDKQVVDQGAIDQTRYTGFLQKASQFIDSAQKVTPVEGTPCRSPFTVTVKIGADTRVTHGCRSADEGGISHLVRDGEFLLSAKKN